jgi:hypothetical protein
MGPTDKDKKTGMWLEEYCAPYFTFKVPTPNSGQITLFVQWRCSLVSPLT